MLSSQVAMFQLFARRAASEDLCSAKGVLPAHAVLPAAFEGGLLSALHGLCLPPQRHDVAHGVSLPLVPELALGDAALLAATRVALALALAPCRKRIATCAHGSRAGAA